MPFVMAAVTVVDMREGYLVVDTEFASLAGVPNPERSDEAKGAEGEPDAGRTETEGPAA